ncbi:RNase E specificity factor CsrD [Rahnella inusitata]|uniref:RNase E specificity factor CsrD n=1 Tax=Rahnella inusitata TaxID=58169 RepID=UPI0039B0DC68
MRFTTRLSALISMLVALAMLLMLLGVTFSFIYLNKQNTEQHLQALTTTYDQALLTQSPEQAQRWLPQAMRMLDVTDIVVKLNSSTVYEYHERPDLHRSWDSVMPEYNTAIYPLVQHPDMSLHVSYIDPVSSYIRSMRSTLTISVAILIMFGMVLLSFRWLRQETDGVEKLEDRAIRILRGEREGLTGNLGEWPHSASSAIDLLLTDLNEAREQRSRVDTLIRAYAQQDSQTGLSNRLFFDNQLATQLEEEGTHGVIMLLRLPDFDLMRETHGQAMVDELRSAMVNLLSTFVMRHVDALLARYFHSDFAVLLPHRTLKEAEVMAAQLVNALGVLPTSSLIDRDALMYIGISAYRFGQTPDQVMDMVQQATRHAAFQGSNSWFIFDNNVPEKGRGSVRWRTLLENTLARGGPRLYQKPAFSRNGKLDHRELQRRVFDGENELLAAEFVPLVVQFGLSQSYDRIMISQIIPLLNRWPDETLAFHLTVDSLLQRSFVRWLRDTLLQCERLQRNRILIELAEADLCQHTDRLRPAIRLLQGLGCRLAVSQAGLTVVSTSYLKTFPVERVKLHPGLVRDIDKRIENQLFVQSLLSACEGTQALVFASGVRTKDEWSILLSKGIHGGQGDFFAGPEPVEPVGKKYSHNSDV